MGRLDFLYRMDLPHRAKSVYIYLADRANKDGKCWPSQVFLPQFFLRSELSDICSDRIILHLSTSY